MAELADLGLADKARGGLLDFIKINGTNEQIIAKLEDFNISDGLFAEGLNELKTVVSQAQNLGLPPANIQIDLSITRGLDYYSRTVFEFVSAAAGAQGTVLGGGRYDTLLEQMGGKAVPAVGFAAGMERLLLVMEAEGKLPAPDDGVECYLAGMDKHSRAQAFLLAQRLRRAGVSCETDLMERSVKAQFKYAGKAGARFVVVIGSNELASGAYTVKDMADSSSVTVKAEEAVAHLKERLS